MNIRGDQDLLRDYAERGSEAAFEELVRRHVDLVYSAALRMVRDPHLAEDVTQRVFEALAQNARRLVPHPVLTGWLHRTTQNIAAKSVRTEMRRRAREQKAVAMIDPAHSESEPLWKRLGPCLDEALDRLSDSDRDVVLLRYFEQKSAREIGRTLGLNEEVAQKRIERALERLRRAFASRGVTVSSAVIVGALAAHSVHAAPAGLAAASAGASLAAATTTTTAAIKAIIMTKAKTALITAIAIAAVVTPIAMQRTNAHLRQTIAGLHQQQSDAASRTAGVQGAAAGNSADSLHWQNIESKDYPEYIARLRAIGCPEQTIRDIVIAGIDRDYRQRIGKLGVAGVQGNYWQKPNYNNMASALPQAQQLKSEEIALLHKLLGPEAVRDLERLTDKRDSLSSFETRFNFILPEKRAQLYELDGYYEEARRSIEDQWKKAGSSTYQEQRDRLGLLEIWRIAAISNLLSPEELKEYNLRAGDHSGQLTENLAAFEPTEAEFRMIHELEDKFGRLPHLATAADIDREADFRRAVEQSLGEKRYADYSLSQEVEFNRLYGLAKLFDLPKEAARSVYDLNHKARGQAETILRDTSLSPESRQAALDALVEQTASTARQVLGDIAVNRLPTEQFEPGWFAHWLHMRMQTGPVGR